jgi:hypothetical protein
MHRYLLASTAIIRVIAFDTGPGFPPAKPGQVNTGIIQTLLNAALIAANQQLPSTEDDLGSRDIASSWMLPYWDLTDDIVAGYDIVKARGTKYLPKFSTESQDDYKDRLELTEFTNVYRDIVEALSGKPFEEEITLVEETDDTTGEATPLPDNIKEFAEDVDGAGNNLTSFAAATFFNGINSAIDWIYVDYPKVDTSVVRSVQQLKDEGIRPFWSHVLGRNVLEVRSEIIGGKELLTYMRIWEPGFPNHVRLFERDIDGVVMMGLFEEVLSPNGLKKTYILIDSAEITIGVIPLVPFITGRRDGRTWKFFPVMRDAADLQIQLYQQESGLKFAKTMTAYPMLAANGINPTKGPDGTPQKLAVGPNRVLYSQRDGTSGNYGSWAYVSPDAACLTFLKADVKETMDQLRELGRQPLTAQSGNLTVITTAYAAGKARTAVGAWSLRLVNTLENAMDLTCMWLAMKSDEYEPVVSIYDEYDDFSTDQSSDLTALKDARASRDLSHENYMKELKRRNVLRPDFNLVENTTQLLNETPSDNTDVVDDGAADLKPGDPGYKAPTSKSVKPQP